TNRPRSPPTRLPSRARSACGPGSSCRSTRAPCCSAPGRSTDSSSRAPRSGPACGDSILRRMRSTAPPQAFVFDAYGTLYDVHSVVQRCETCWTGKGAALSQLWRAKQLEYTWQRSLMNRYAPFSTVTREALAYACEALRLELSVAQMEGLMGEY